MTFPIFYLDEKDTFDEEPMGTKEKRWIKKDGELWLFKHPRNDTGERWAEKVAYELACLLGLPAAQVEFATLNVNGIIDEGTICKQFTRIDEQLVHGNELLARTFTQYDRQKRFGQKDYQLDLIMNALEQLSVRGPHGLDEHSGTFYFCGFLVLDAWIANTDRHHENWGVLKLSNPDTYCIAPTYDHASSLGRLLTDTKRTNILEGKERLTLGQFLTRAKAQGAIHTSQNNQVPPFLLIQDGQKIGYKDALDYWIQRLNSLSSAQIDTIFKKVPQTIISSIETKFARSLLSKTQEMINATVQP